MAKTNMTESELLKLGYKVEGGRAVKVGDSNNQALVHQPPKISRLFKNSFFIPGNVPSKKNSKQFKQITDKKGKVRTIIVNSDYANTYIKEHISDYLHYTERVREITSTLLKPYHIEFYFIRETKSAFDYVNMLQMPLDLMVEAKWLADDDCDNVVPVIGGFHVDKNNAGVIITFKNFVQRVNL